MKSNLTTFALAAFGRHRLFLAALLLTQGLSAATYYISPSGNDSNPGTVAAPFLTLQQGVNHAVAGDTVIVGDGTYGNNNAVTGGDSSENEAAAVTLYNSGTSAAWITIEAAHKGAAILDCEMLCDSYINLYNASYIVIQNLVITHGYKEAIHSNDAAHDITLRGNVFEYIANRASSATYGMDGMYTNPDCYNFIIDGNLIHDIGRTNTNITSLDHGLYMHGSNFTVINNIFYNINHGWSIQLADGMSNMLIANNTFGFANGQSGQIMLWNTQSNLTIENNIFYNPANYAITTYTSSVTSCSIDHNLVYGASGIMAGSNGCTLGTNLVGANPLFTNVSSAPYDFHLQAGSPAIDAGVNLAAVNHDFDLNPRPLGSSTDIGAYEFVPVVIAIPPPVISGVFSSGVLQNAAVVNWSTNEASTSSVQYGLTSSYTMTSPQNLTMLTQHSVSLSNLTASTVYHYRVSSTNSTGGVTYSSDSTFTTAAVPTAISLAAAAPTLSVMQGQSATDGITTTLISGLPVAVSFSASSLPPGVTATFSAPSCMATCSSTLTLSASGAAATGTFPVVIGASGSATSASVSVSLTVSAVSNLTSGLAAWWNLNELKGTTTADSSGNGNTGTLNNVTWSSTVCTACISLSGSNSYVSVAESPSLETPSQMTVSMWLRAASTTNTDPRPIAKLYSWDVKLNGTNRSPQFSAGGLYGMINYSLPLNQWQHVVFTFSAGVLQGYINGKPAPFATNTFTAGSTLPVQMYGVYLGTDPSKTDSYAGYLDDVRIYNRALSASDVATLYSTTLH